MSEEKRVGEKAIPDNVDVYLNDLQKIILGKINKFGWSLKFVRRPSDENPIIAIQDQDGNKIGVMLDDGGINFDTGLKLRDE